MGWRDPDTPADLTPIRSAAIRWVIERAVARGNRVLSLAQWSKALVAHMEGGLTPDLKADVAAHWPDLGHYVEAGTPHNKPDEGYVDSGFAVSFPTERPA
jgi:hypothetical protein